MGAWSTTILGSDDAYDVLALADDLMGLDNAWFDHPEQVKAGLESVSEAQWLAFIAAQHEPEVAAQVVAYMHLNKGAPLSPHLAAVALAACEDEDLSKWNDPKERQGHLNALAQTIRQYDGTPTELPQEGLFEVISRKLG